MMRKAQQRSAHSLLRGIVRIGACVCIFLAVLWSVGLASGGPLVVHLGRHAHVGFDGLSIRIVTTKLPSDDSSIMDWDVLGSSFQCERDSNVAYVWIPVVPIFAVAIVATLIFWTIGRRDRLLPGLGLE